MRLDYGSPFGMPCMFNGVRTHSKQIYDRQNHLKIRQDNLRKTILKQIVRHERKLTQRSRASTTESQVRLRTKETHAGPSTESLSVPPVFDGDDMSSVGSCDSDDDKKTKVQTGHGLIAPFSF